MLGVKSRPVQPPSAVRLKPFPPIFWQLDLQDWRFRGVQGTDPSPGGSLDRALSTTQACSSHSFLQAVTSPACGGGVGVRLVGVGWGWYAGLLKV